VLVTHWAKKRLKRSREPNGEALDVCVLFAEESVRQLTPGILSLKVPGVTPQEAKVHTRNGTSLSTLTGIPIPIDTAFRANWVVSPISLEMAV
jgi:hypothetical protein